MKQHSTEVEQLLKKALEDILNRVPEGDEYDPGQFVMDVEKIANDALYELGKWEKEKQKKGNQDKKQNRYTKTGWGAWTDKQDLQDKIKFRQKGKQSEKDICSRCGDEYFDILGIGYCGNCFHKTNTYLQQLKNIIPIRIQRSRQHKQISPNRLPIVYVGRPSKWGNPFPVSSNGFVSRQDVVVMYEDWINNNLELQGQVVLELKGKNLSCFCKIGEPCHADILLQIANKKQ